MQDLELRAGAGMAEGPEWLEPVRRAAADRFGATGFPTAKDEEWRFTPVGPIAHTRWRPTPSVPTTVPADRLTPFNFGHPEWTTLVFVNGAYSEALSRIADLPRGVRVGSLAEALRGDGQALEAHLTRHAPFDGSPFTALNTAGFRDGGVLHVPAGLDLERPVHFVYVTTEEAEGTAIHPRNVIVVERGARASVIESYVTLAPGGMYWTNPVTEVAAGRRLLAGTHPHPARERAGVPRRPDPRGPAARQPLPVVLDGDGRRIGSAQPARPAQR